MRRVTGRSILLLASLAVALTGVAPAAGAAPVTSGSAHRFDPGRAQVVGGRFTSTVKLDGGVLTIRPAPKRLMHESGEAAAETKAWATGNVMGDRAVAFGFGLVSVAQRSAGVPKVTDLPAWVGLVYADGATFSCPAALGGSERTKLPPLPSDGYAAVVIGDEKGSPAVVYRARSEACGTVVKSNLTNVLESISVPWIPNGVLVSELLSVQVDLPSCSGIEGISTGGSAAAMTITIDARARESGRPELHAPTGGGSHGHPRPREYARRPSSTGVVDDADTARSRGAHSGGGSSSQRMRRDRLPLTSRSDPGDADQKLPYVGTPAVS